MVRVILGAALLLTSSALAGNPVRIAVIDSGLNLQDVRFKPHLCTSGHKDMTGEGLVDTDGHGTHVAGLIVKYAKKANYCLVIVKYHSKDRNRSDYLGALLYATSLKVDIINYSGGGPGELFLEKYAILFNPKIKFIAAAGNDNKNLDETKYFPASYGFKNIIVVGALDGRVKAAFSNYGSIVKIWEQGEKIHSASPIGEQDMSGTSMSTAIFTGKYVYGLR